MISIVYSASVCFGGHRYEYQWVTEQILQRFERASIRIFILANFDGGFDIFQVFVVGAVGDLRCFIPR